MVIVVVALPRLVMDLKEVHSWQPWGFFGGFGHGEWLDWVESDVAGEMRK